MLRAGAWTPEIGLRVRRVDFALGLASHLHRWRLHTRGRETARSTRVQGGVSALPLTPSTFVFKHHRRASPSRVGAAASSTGVAATYMYRHQPRALWRDHGRDPRSHFPFCQGGTPRQPTSGARRCGALAASLINTVLRHESRRHALTSPPTGAARLCDGRRASALIDLH